MGLDTVVETLLPAAGRLFGDALAAYNAFEEARSTLSETDRAKADAAYQASILKRQMDQMRVVLELLAAEQR